MIEAGKWYRVKDDKQLLGRPFHWMIGQKVLVLSTTPYMGKLPIQHDHKLVPRDGYSLHAQRIREELLIDA